MRGRLHIEAIERVIKSSHQPYYWSVTISHLPPYPCGVNTLRYYCGALCPSLRSLTGLSEMHRSDLRQKAPKSMQHFDAKART